MTNLVARECTEVHSACPFMQIATYGSVCGPHHREIKRVTRVHARLDAQVKNLILKYARVARAALP